MTRGFNANEETIMGRNRAILAHFTDVPRMYSIRRKNFNETCQCTRIPPIDENTPMKSLCSADYMSDPDHVSRVCFSYKHAILVVKKRWVTFSIDSCRGIVRCQSGMKIVSKFNENLYVALVVANKIIKLWFTIKRPLFIQDHIKLQYNTLFNFNHIIYRIFQSSCIT